MNLVSLGHAKNLRDLGENINVKIKGKKLTFAEISLFENNAFKQKRTRN